VTYTTIIGVSTNTISYLNSSDWIYTNCNFSFLVDNIFCIGSWVKNKFGYDESTISKQFGIPENLDYLD